MRSLVRSGTALEGAGSQPGCLSRAEQARCSPSELLRACSSERLVRPATDRAAEHSREPQVGLIGCTGICYLLAVARFALLLPVRVAPAIERGQPNALWANPR